jgi:hypothetical protein
VLLKTQWNRAVLFRTRFTTIWRSEMHIGKKVDADTSVGVYGVQSIMSVKEIEGITLGSAHASTIHDMR